MWVRSSIWLAAASFIVAGCSPEGTAAGPTRRRPDSPWPLDPPPTIAPTVEAPTVVPLAAAVHVAAFTAAGDLAIVDARTGAIVAQAAGGGGVPRDVALDAARHRIVTVESDEDDGGGEVAAHSIGASHELGARSHVAWIDGRLRVLPVPAGLVAFEEGYAERWKLLASAETSGVAAGRPTSAWWQAGWGTTWVHALVPQPGDGSTSFVWTTAAVSTNGIAPPTPRATLDEPWPDHTDARLVPGATSSGPLLVERCAGDLAVRSAAGDAFGPATVVATGVGGRIEAAVALAPDLVAVALSEPARLGFVSLVDPAAPGFSAVPLAAAPIRSDRLPDRDLAPVGPRRVLVATESGLVSVRFANGDAALDGAFDGTALRGPVAPID